MLEDASASSFRQYLTIARLLAGQLDFRSAIRAVAKEIALIIPHDHMDVCIITPGSTFHTAYESGLETDWSKRPPALIEHSPIRALLVGETDSYITPDASRDPRFHFEGSFSDPIRAHGLKSRLHVALKVHGETIGALSFSSLSTDFYTPRDLSHAQSIGDLLAPYFFAIRAAEQAKQSAIVEEAARVREEALRQGAARLTELLEAERQRIGMDLHDQTLGDLTRFARRLERLSLMDSVPGDKLEPLFRSLQQSMQDLRQIIEQARPSVLQLFGLVDAIENHLERSIRDSGLVIAAELADDSSGASGRLSPNVAITLFRIAQEAINNAVRHAQASRITVAFSRKGDRLMLEISDDGIGMGKAEKSGGSGLDNMRVRARLIGGRFSCGSEDGRTFVRVSLRMDETGDGR
ncbi:signal transduction histidine kinase [Neorhizobium galegae]|uniref:GAF domain-containing sensor histidine kinase n=1 Tax=Neorhizobium galegae TaxID=399 RepID=UPI001AEA69D2|nr:GAF domain-containing sensor histidine kinase [Neorhizobium galegae]MBP2550742.1 signal transduction histidine kinase [Neorhizobium galegae]